MTVGSAVATTESRAVEMRVTDVRQMAAREDRAGRHFVVLEEVGGERGLTFWVGAFEGHALATLLEKVQPNRPLTHTFLAGVLKAAGGRLKEVRITRLADTTFYAVAAIESAAGAAEVDARPSDAVSLALLTDAPILVEPSVLTAVEQGTPPDNLPARQQLASLRERSVGRTEIVAEMQARWPNAQLKPAGQ